MSKTAAQLYESAVQRNMKRFRKWVATFKPTYWKSKAQPLAELKHTLGIKASDTRFDAELTTALNS